MTNYRSGALVFDLETIPAQNNDLIAQMSRDFHETFKISDSLSKDTLGKAAGLDDSEIKSLSKPELQAAYAPIAAEKEFDKIYRSTALDGGMGEVISIGFLDPAEGNSTALTRTLKDSESDLLAQFNESVSRVRSDGYKTKDVYFIGHNIANFDLKFLWKRLLVNNIKPCFKIPINGWHGKDFYDTMLGWNGKSYGSKDKKSLDFVCKALGMEGKGDIDGSMVWDYVMEGRYSEINKYAAQDASDTFELYKRLNFFN